MAAAAHASAAASTGGGSIRVLHRRFVLALLLEGHTNDDVRAVLEREDLDEVDDASLNRMRSELSPPKRFSARSRKHRASVEYLDGLGVSALIHHEPDAEDALRLLRLPKARDVAECGLVLRVPLEAIVVQLRHQGVTATPKAIERFEKGLEIPGPHVEPEAARTAGVTEYISGFLYKAWHYLQGAFDFFRDWMLDIEKSTKDIDALLKESGAGQE